MQKTLRLGREQKSKKRTYKNRSPDNWEPLETILSQEYARLHIYVIRVFWLTLRDCFLQIEIK